MAITTGTIRISSATASIISRSLAMQRMTVQRNAEQAIAKGVDVTAFAFDLAQIEKAQTQIAEFMHKMGWLGANV